VNPENDVGPRQHEHVVVAAQLPGMRLESLAAEILFCELMALDHRAHGAVQDENALTQEVFEPRTSVYISHWASVVGESMVDGQSSLAGGR
jgi:hypothetical protein